MSVCMCIYRYVSIYVGHRNIYIYICNHECMSANGFLLHVDIHRVTVCVCVYTYIVCA